MLLGFVFGGLALVLFAVVLCREIWLYANARTRWKSDWRTAFGMSLGLLLGLLAMGAMALYCIYGEPCID